MEVFGSDIHTYKYSEGVADGVVLDLVYEARDVDQELGSQDKIDAWFDAKTKGLNDWQKDELRKQWGTMQRVLSSRSRMERIVNDIVFDFSTKPRLSSERATAMLVASTIFERASTTPCSRRRSSKATAPSSLPTTRRPRTSHWKIPGRPTETDKQFIYNPTRRC